MKKLNFACYKTPIFQFQVEFTKSLILIVCSQQDHQIRPTHKDDHDLDEVENSGTKPKTKTKKKTKTKTKMTKIFQALPFSERFLLMNVLNKFPALSRW